jgi:hypothetical protein
MVQETMQLVVFQDHNYTSMVIVDDGGNIIGMGEAKRDPQDDVNLEIGGVLAMGRAFDDVARHALKRADGLIRNADNVKAAKADARFQAWWKAVTADSWGRRC